MSSLAWPLPLTPFELMMFYDHRRDYPMTFTCHFEFSGEFDRDRLERCLALTLERHPLLTSRVVEIDGYPHWLPLPPPWPDVEEDSFLDLRRRNGLRVVARPRPGGFTTTWEFHHACCDGIGSVAVVDDWLRLYDGDALSPRSLDSLLQRANFQRTSRPPRPRAGPWWEPLSSLLNGIKIAWDVVTARPARLAGRGNSRALITGQRRLAIPARVGGTSVNDLLLAALFETLTAWNEERAGADPRRLNRITVPVNLRLPTDRSMPAANVISYAFFDRREGECLDRSALLNSVRTARLAIMRRNLSRYFVDALAWGARWPAFVRWNLNRDFSFSTAVMSYLGPYARGLELHTGPTRVVAMGGAPPIRPGTSLALAVLPFRGCLQVDGLADGSVLTEDDLDRLLDLFCQRIRS